MDISKRKKYLEHRDDFNALYEYVNDLCENKMENDAEKVILDAQKTFALPINLIEFFLHKKDNNGILTNAFNDYPYSPALHRLKVEFLQGVEAKINEIKQSIELIGGKNTLTVTVVDENDKSVTYQKEYTAGNIPEIKLEAVSNGVKIISSCQDGIEKIIYNWDNQQSETISVDNPAYEGTIETPKGKHTLNIQVIGKNGIEATKTQVVVGDTEPTVEVKAELTDTGVQFVIDAEDDEKITKVEVTFNDQEKEIIEVNDSKYNKRIDMKQGENKLLVTVYNVNGLQKTVGRKFSNN